MFLRLVDIDNGGRSGGDPAVLWEHEMWIGFEWVRSDQPYFYTFESDVLSNTFSIMSKMGVGLCVWSDVLGRA